MEAIVKTGQEEMKVAMMARQEKIRAMINSIQSEFEETINSWVEGILASVDS
jgi:hypothetical protein